MPGYTIIRADHPSCRQKGEYVLPPDTEIEAQVAQIGLKLNNRSYQIGSFYSDPSSRFARGLLWNILYELRSQFLLGGDFNRKRPRWGSNTMTLREQLLHDALS